MSQLSPTLFPGISSSVEGHAGFIAEHAQTASTILSETKRLISAKGATTVILVSRIHPPGRSGLSIDLYQVGHSLGGALAELDSLFMAMNLPSSIHVKGVTYGTPRVGNPAYAAFFDSKVRNVGSAHYAALC